MIRQLAADGKTVLVSSHILTELAEMCDRVGIIERGRLLAVGTVDEIQRKQTPHRSVNVRILGGAAELSTHTGSRAFERFTGPQIRKFFKTDPAGYAATDRVHLVSSFMASLLAGRHAPLEPGDASGMNLMELAERRWAPAALDATAPDLARKLPPIHESWTVTGTLSPYWQKRYGFGPACLVPWSGDNPSSLIGLGLVTPGALGVSLGTSDTVFGPIARPTHLANATSHLPRRG